MQNITNINTVVSGVTNFDMHILNIAVSSDIRLYKGSPLTYPPLPNDDALTLEDCDFRGGIEGEAPVSADIFYDFSASRILGNGKVKF